MNGRHPASSAAQYNIKPDPMEGISGIHRHAGPRSPRAQKASTFGSIQQATAWDTPFGVPLSAQTNTSNLFDQPTTVAQMPRQEGS